MEYYLYIRKNMEKNIVITDNLRRFGTEFQVKCISSLLTDRAFLERILDIISPDYFELDASKWIIQEICKYFYEYKDIPTLTVFKVKVDSIENESLKKSVVDQLRSIYQKISDTDINYVKETFLEFCKNQSLKNAMLTGVEYLKLGEYEKIRTEIDKALKAGAERNLGTDFIVDVDRWLSENARTCTKTGWELVDNLLDGGLGNGELGIIMAPAGIGKCVGPTTEIEIKYVEFGIPMNDENGKEYILWISPLKKYNLGDKNLFGWQIQKLLSINVDHWQEMEGIQKI